MADFRVFGKQPCPVCGQINSGCKKRVGKNLILCRNEADHVHGYRCTGPTRSGVWFMFSEDERQFTPKQRKEKAKRDKKIDAVRIAEEKAIVYNDDERDIAMRAWIESAKDNEFPKEAYADLLKRGLTAEQIVQYNLVWVNNREWFKSPTQLPGGDYRNIKRYGGKSGVLVPIYNVDGQIVGTQIKVAEGGYRWLHKTTDELGNVYTNYNKHKELPLQVINKNTKILGLCEGFLKAIVAAEKLGHSMVGAASNHFTISSKTLWETIEKLNPEVIVYYPDAGNWANKQIRDKTKELFKWFKELGIKVIVCDWGQLFEKEEGNDIDDINLLYKPGHGYYDSSFYLNAKSPKGFRFKTGEIESMEVFYKSRKIDDKLFIPDNNVRSPYGREFDTIIVEKESVPYSKEALQKGKRKFVLNEASVEERKAIMHDVLNHDEKLIILDSSGTGTGKSYLNGKLDITEFFPMVEGGEEKAYASMHKILLASPQPRNPTTPEVEERYTLMPSRHSGLANPDEKTTPTGKPWLQRAKKGEKHLVQSNCAYTKLFTKVHEAQLDGVNICQACPFKMSCRSSEAVEEKGKGYLYEKGQAMTEKHLRLHPNALTMSMFNGNKKNILIIDEPKQCMETVREYHVTLDYFKELSAALDFFDFRFGTEMRQLFYNFVKSPNSIEANKHGLNFTELKSKLPEISTRKYNVWVQKATEFIEFYKTDFTNNIAKTKRAKLENNWIDPAMPLDLIQTMYGDRPDVTFTYTWIEKELTLTRYKRNKKVAECVTAATLAVFQDATLNRKELAMMLDVDIDRIVEIHAQRKIPQNLDIEFIHGLGNGGKTRSGNAEKNIEKAIAAIEAEKGDTGVIDHKGMRQGCLTHMSDAIGSNEYENKKAVVSVGLPLPNINAILSQYEVLSGEKLVPSSIDFQQFYNQKVRTNVIQEIGRPRANRRPDENIHFAFITEHRLPFLAREGYKVKSTPAAKYLGFTTNSRHSKMILITQAATELIRRGYDKITQKDIIDLSGISQSVISKTVKGFKSFIDSFKSAVDKIRKFIDLDDDQACIEVLRDEVGEEFAELIQAARFSIPGYFRDMKAGEITDEELNTEIENYRVVYEKHWDIIVGLLPIEIQSYMLVNELKKASWVIRASFLRAAKHYETELLTT